MEIEAQAALAGALKGELEALATLQDQNGVELCFRLDDDDALDHADDEPFDEDAEMQDIVSAMGGSSGAHVPSDLAQAISKLCKVCGKNPAQKNQFFCSSPCDADVRGAIRQAKEQGPEAVKALQALRKTNPDEFVAAIHICRAKCASAGRGYRRPQFSLVRYHMSIILASRLQKGTRCLWLTKFAYAHHKKTYEGLSEPQAFESFERELATLPAGRVSDCRTNILWPVEEFVTCMEEKAQEEQTQYGTKEKKKPTDFDIQSRVDMMSTDHHSVNSSEFYGGALGMEPKAMQGISVFS